jgi:hypothetical protein
VVSGGASEVAAGVAEQRKAADGLYRCLRSAELPATIVEADGIAQVGWEATGREVFAVDPYGGRWLVAGLSRKATDPEVEDAYVGFLARHFADGSYSYGLEVDGVDYSEIYLECMESTGYDVLMTEFGNDVGKELAGKQQLAEKTNDWVACARSSGYPDWGDVEIGTADNWVTAPTFFIPLTMSVESVRALLVSCPAFDSDIARRLEDGEYDVNDASLVQPSVKIEAPGVPNPDVVDGMDAEYMHYAELTEVLEEAQTAFYSSRVDSEPGDLAHLVSR